MPRKRRIAPPRRPEPPDSLAATWRLFVAVPSPAGVQAMIRTAVERLSADDALPVRWVDPDETHITLQFIGEVPGEQAELIRLALAPVVAAHPVFHLRTADLGTFPNLRRPRVLWLGLHGPTHRLEALRRDLTQALAAIEAPHDTDEYHPHLTIGRVRGVPAHRLRDLSERIRQGFETLAAEGVGTARQPVPIPVDEVVLIRAVLDHRGARYDVVARFPLAPRPSRVAAPSSGRAGPAGPVGEDGPGPVVG